MFEEWLAKQSTVRLICRIQGHWWPGYELDGASRLGAAPVTHVAAYVLSMYCEREFDGENCGVYRRAYFNTNYTPHMNAYVYPPGYMLPELTYLSAARRGRIRQELDIRAEEAA